MPISTKFKKFKSKPIERLAYQIKDSDKVVRCTGENTNNEHVIYFDNKNESYLRFVAHEEVKVGDYIVHLNDKDIYHCNAKVFAERNIVE